IIIPPLLEILDHCEKERYSEIVVGTTGLLGLVGIAAGKLLGIRVTVLQPAEAPLDVRHLAGSSTLEDLASTYLRWFLGTADGLAEENAPEIAAWV
ncbi:MAG TPA: hypothetical protein VLT87_28220, partial [Thermoanaerobaculia bacterium]|nr:hypothetical protein [Thermoanaerobaculia bacterium]